MSQVLFKHTPATVPAADSSMVEKAHMDDAITYATAKETLSKALAASEDFKKDFMKTLAEACTRLRSIREMMGSSYLPYSVDNKLSDEERIELDTMRKTIDTNLDIERFARGCW